MFLNSARSVFQKPGARIAPGRSLGRAVWVEVGTVKAEELNQLPRILCGAPEFGSPTCLTRQPPGVAPKQAEPMASTQFAPVPAVQPALPMEAVSGSPVWK